MWQFTRNQIDEYAKSQERGFAVGAGINDGSVAKTTIEGVLLEPLAVIPAAGGPVLKMLSPKARCCRIFPAVLAKSIFQWWKRAMIKALETSPFADPVFAVPVGQIKIALLRQPRGFPDKRGDFETELGLPLITGFADSSRNLGTAFANMGKRRP